MVGNCLNTSTWSQMTKIKWFQLETRKSSANVLANMEFEWICACSNTVFVEIQVDFNSDNSSLISLLPDCLMDQYSICIKH